MPRWVVTVLVIDAILIPIAVLLIVFVSLWAGLAVILVDGLVTAVIVLRNVSGEADRNAKLSAGGVPGKTPQQGTEARIFED